MNLLQILLQISLLFSASPSNVPEKSLSQITSGELIMLMNDANEQIKEKEVISLLDETCEKLNGQVLVAQGHRIIYQKSVGFKKLYKDIPNLKQRNVAKFSPNNRLSDSTMLELASVSKQFTAAAILKLASEGKLDTNDFVTKFFPSFPYSKITVKQLLTHTSGLPDYIDFKDQTFPVQTNFSNTELIKYFSNKRPKIVANPLTRFEYCNSNYAILAAIVEKVSGVSFSDYLQKNFFQPVKMHSTCTYLDLDNQNFSNYAYGHLNSQSEVPFHFMNKALGDKGVYSTALDLYRWALAYFIDYKVLPKVWVDLATSPRNRCYSGMPSQLYGYGYRLENSPDFGYQVYHGGLWRGFTHIFLYRPEDQMIIIFLSNYRNRAHSGKCDAIFSILDGV